MKSTHYFDEQVPRKRPYIQPEWCLTVVAAPLRQDVQEDARMRHWGAVVDPRDGKERILRVIALEDGETIHNAFFDRNLRRDLP